MTQFIEGTTVFHVIERLDHAEPGRPDHAEAHCGETGEPVEADPDDEDLCGNCLSELNPDEETEDAGES